MKIALLLVGHLRSNPKDSFLRNLEMIQSIFGVAPEDISVFVSTYDVRGNSAEVRKNYDDESTPWVADHSDAHVFEDLAWIENQPAVAFFEKETFAETQLLVGEEVKRLLEPFGPRVTGSGLVASGVAQSRKIVRLWELAKLTNSDFDLVVKSRPDACASFQSPRALRVIPRPREIIAVGELEYVTEHPTPPTGKLRKVQFLAKRRPFMNDIVYWASKETFERWVALLNDKELHTNLMTEDLASVPLRSSSRGSRKQTEESWAMPELRFASLAASSNIKVRTIRGSVVLSRS